MGTTSNKLKRHQQVLIQYLEELAAKYNNALGNELHYQVLVDETRNHFQLTKLGWAERRHYFSVLLHFDIKPDAKIWVQLNDTEILIGPELITRGVSPKDIVIGFHPEYLREHTEYAVK